MTIQDDTERIFERRPIDASYPCINPEQGIGYTVDIDRDKAQIYVFAGGRVHIIDLDTVVAAEFADGLRGALMLALYKGAA